MDPASLLVLVIMTSPEAMAGQAAERSLRQAVASNVVVERVEAPSREDAALERLCESEHAAVIVVVTWAHDSQDARLHVFRCDEHRWVDRDIHFRSVDVPRERGRTIGFALASMMPDQALPTASRTDSAARAGAATGTPPNAGAKTEGAKTEGARATDAQPIVVPLVPSEEDKFRTEPIAVPQSVGRTFRESRASVELLGRGVMGLGDRSAGGWGASIAGRYQLSPTWALRLATNARFDDVPAARASTTLIGAGAGVGWQAWTSPLRRASIGARAMGLVIRHQFSHFDRDEPEVVRAVFWSAGAELAADAAWRFTDTAAIAAGVGAEWIAGDVNLYFRDQKVTEVPNVRLFAEMGVRVFF